MTLLLSIEFTNDVESTIDAKSAELTDATKGFEAILKVLNV